MIWHWLTDKPAGMYSSSDELMWHLSVQIYFSGWVHPWVCLQSMSFLFFTCTWFIVIKSGFLMNSVKNRYNIFFPFLSLSYLVSLLSITIQLSEEKWSFYHSSRAHIHRPSCVATEVERLNALMQKKIGQSVLGKVREHDACKHLIGWYYVNKDDIYEYSTHTCCLHTDFCSLTSQKGTHME